MEFSCDEKDQNILLHLFTTHIAPTLSNRVTWTTRVENGEFYISLVDHCPPAEEVEKKESALDRIEKSLEEAVKFLFSLE